MNHEQDREQLLKLIRIYEHILEGINEGVHVVDEKGTSIIYNKKMSEIEAMDKDQVINKNLLEVFSFDNEQNSTLLQALKQQKTTSNVKQTYFNNEKKEITTINKTFPIYDHHQLIGAIEIANDVTKMERMIKGNIFKKGNTRFTFDQIIGDSLLINEVVENAKRAARTTSSVLIVGETGTGKELFAQSIHNGSTRSNGPFLSQNCAAIPENLMESLLFGTKKGAFTGATDHPGLFEQAEGGTLFLDEINSLTPALQAKLLRVLQEKTLRRIGDTKDKETNVRIIAAINEDPIDAISNNRIRKDLFYRLGVVTIVLPPLRERKEDIFKLVHHFITKFNHLFQMDVCGITNEVKQFFSQYDWPGNVRELENIIEGAMNLIMEETEIDFCHLPSYLRRKSNLQPEISYSHLNEESAIDENINLQTNSNDLKTLMEKYEEVCIRRAIQKNGGNITRTAQELGISRQSLQYRIRKYNIQKKIIF